MLNNLTLEQAVMTCERLRKSIESETTEFEGQSISITVSGGIAQVARYSDIQTTLSAADEALFEAKRSGRNQLAVAAP